MSYSVIIYPLVTFKGFFNLWIKYLSKEKFMEIVKVYYVN